MPENAGPKGHGHGPGSGSRAKGAYQDRDKPAQIRSSNIAAGKGEGAAGVLRGGLGAAEAPRGGWHTCPCLLSPQPSRMPSGRASDQRGWIKW